jgi:signal transduction histidine kinase
LQQVLVNLMMNAIEAMSTTTAQPRRLRIRSGINGAREASVSVSDSGPGIAAADQRQLFDAFFTTKSQGMGMGLSISRSIIEAHGGHLWASSNENGGATFEFTVPVEVERPS